MVSLKSNLKIKRIALINFGGLGDAILFLPVVEATLKLCPEAKISFITENRASGIADLLPSGLVEVQTLNIQGKKRHQLFFELFQFLIKGHYDAVLSSGSSPWISILLSITGIPVKVGFDRGRLSQRLLTEAAPLNQNQYAAKMHFELARAFAKVLNRPNALEDLPAYPKSLNPKVFIDEALPDLDAGKKWVALHPGVSKASIQKNILKGWSVHQWVKLAESLNQFRPDIQLVLLGGPDDDEVVKAISKALPENVLINLSGKTPTIKSLSAIFKQLSALVCVDSAPMHLAVALGTPVVPLFSGTDERKLIPESLLSFVASRPVEEVPCRPCLFDKRKTSCPQPICLDIRLETVFDKVAQLLS